MKNRNEPRTRRNVRNTKHLKNRIAGRTHHDAIPVMQPLEPRKLLSVAVPSLVFDLNGQAAHVGSLSTNGDSVEYHFTPGQSGTAMFDHGGDAVNDANLTMQLFQGNTLVATENNNDSSTSFSVDLLQGNEYRLVVSSNVNVKVDYATSIDLPDPVVQTLQLDGHGGIHTSQMDISTPTQAYYFKYDAPVSGTVKMDASGQEGEHGHGNSLGTDIFVYDANGNEIFRDVRGYSDGEWSSAMTAGDTYFVQVRQDIYDSRTGAFSLEVQSENGDHSGDNYVLGASSNSLSQGEKLTLSLTRNGNGTQDNGGDNGGGDNGDHGGHDGDGDGDQNGSDNDNDGDGNGGDNNHDGDGDGDQNGSDNDNDGDGNGGDNNHDGDGDGDQNGNDNDNDGDGNGGGDNGQGGSDLNLVRFYRDSNGNGSLDASDQLLGTDTNGRNGWAWNGKVDSSWGTGIVKMFAQAEANDPANNAVYATTVTVDQAGPGSSISVVENDGDTVKVNVNGTNGYVWYTTNGDGSIGTIYVADDNPDSNVKVTTTVKKGVNGDGRIQANGIARLSNGQFTTLTASKINMKNVDFTDGTIMIADASDAKFGDISGNTTIEGQVDKLTLGQVSTTGALNLGQVRKLKAEALDIAGGVSASSVEQIDIRGDANFDLNIDGLSDSVLKKIKVRGNASGNWKFTGPMTLNNVQIDGNANMVVEAMDGMTQIKKMKISGVGENDVTLNVASTVGRIDVFGDLNVGAGSSVSQVDHLRIRGNLVSGSDLIIAGDVGDLRVDGLMASGASIDITGSAGKVTFDELSGTLTVEGTNGANGIDSLKVKQAATNARINVEHGIKSASFDSLDQVEMYVGLRNWQGGLPANYSAFTDTNAGIGKLDVKKTSKNVTIVAPTIDKLNLRTVDSGGVLNLAARSVSDASMILNGQSVHDRDSSIFERAAEYDFLNLLQL